MATLLYMTEFSGILMGSQLLFALRKKWEQTEKRAKLLKLYWRAFHAVLVYQGSIAGLTCSFQVTFNGLTSFRWKTQKGFFPRLLYKIFVRDFKKESFSLKKQSKSLTRQRSEVNSFFAGHANPICKLNWFFEIRTFKDG